MAFAAGMLCLLVVSDAGGGQSGTSQPCHPCQVEAPRIELETSDRSLSAAFDWARRQALAYAFDRGDPVGPWYEAALPGREAFCMRDVSHQSLGAHFLGLDRHTRNMLRAFASNIAESRDWCSFWEINRYGLPALVDYRNDTEFWYNLPANFDVLDACYRMYLWTGYRAYLDDHEFLNFYRRTVSDYVNRWDLSVERIMERQRIMNVREKSGKGSRFAKNRGIPGYDEQERGFVAGVDLLAVEYAGYTAYARIEQWRGEEEEARGFLNRAAQVQKLLNTVWWHSSVDGFYSWLSPDHKLAGANFDPSVLYYGAVENGIKSNAVVNGIARRITNKTAIGIEEQSHLPEILYRYGQDELAYQQVLDLASESKSRREYPEVSYSLIGAVVTGLMGIELATSEPENAQTQDLYLDTTLTTIPRLSAATAWAQIQHVPVRSNDISVRHDGRRKTTLANLSGPSLMWRACFPGRFAALLVNGTSIRAESVTPTATGEPLACATVAIGAGGSKTVEVSP